MRYVAKLPKEFASFQQPPDIRGCMRLVDTDEALEIFPAIFRRAAAERPGTYERSAAWWRHRLLDDPEFARGAATGHRRVVVTQNGEPAGYAIYRTQPIPDSNVKDVRVLELVGVNPAAEKSLWQYLFGIDIVASIRYWNLPVDSPMPWWLEQACRLDQKLEYSLWVRVMDVATALSNRKYATAGALRFQLVDEFCEDNSGVYELEVDASGSATCQRVADHGNFEISLSAFALGATYLGGQRFSELSRAGFVTGEATSVAKADGMFSWPVQPWCQQVF